MQPFSARKQDISRYIISITPVRRTCISTPDRLNPTLGPLARYSLRKSCKAWPSNNNDTTLPAQLDHGKITIGVSTVYGANSQHGMKDAGESGMQHGMPYLGSGTLPT